MAAILFFIGSPKSTGSKSDKRFSSYRVHKISCIVYSVNFQTAVAAILIFVECPKSIASAISKCEVNQTSGFQATAFTSNIMYRVQC